MGQIERFMSASEPGIDVDYLASLARVELTEGERAQFASQLREILNHFQQLQEVDVTGVEPTAHANVVENVLRPDEPGPVLSLEEVLRHAPAARNGQIVVPKVVDDA